MGADYYPGFNRYMVECEYKATGTARHVVTVLIDTWWNVNMTEIQWMKRRLEF